MLRALRAELGVEAPHQGLGLGLGDVAVELPVRPAAPTREDEGRGPEAERPQPLEPASRLCDEERAVVRGGARRGVEVEPDDVRRVRDVPLGEARKRAARLPGDRAEVVHPRPDQINR